MSQLFDPYKDSYEATVEDSIAFSGLKHDFFMEAKADLLRDILAERLAGTPEPAMLDVGCGVGRAHPWLTPVVGSLTGTDPSPHCIERARRDHPHVRYEVGDGHVLPFADGSFDAAVAICVMHHVDPEAWGAFLAEMRRVVRPGGTAIVIEHNPWNPATRLAVARCPFDRDAVLLGARRTKRLFERSGFTDVSSRHFLLVPSKRPVMRAIERALSKLPLGAQYAVAGTA